MPALVTTPTDAPLDAITTPTKYPVGSAITRAPTPPAVTILNANAIRNVPGLPIRRWNGTTWVTLYRPRT